MNPTTFEEQAAPVVASPPDPTLVRLAAVASAAAGLVHATAAGSHTDLAALAFLFTVAAVAQVGWALWAATQPVRPVVLLGALLNSAFVVFWAMTKVTGIGFVEGLEEAQAIGGADLVATTLQLGAVMLATAALLREPAAASSRARVPALAVGSVLALGLAVPAMAVPHDHDHDHGGGDVAAHAEAHGDDGHAHDTSAAGAGHSERLQEQLEEHVAAGKAHGDDGHAHDGSTSGTAATASLAAQAPGADEATPAQIAKADTLIEEMEGWIVPRFATTAAAEAAGYRSIGDGITGYEHFVHGEYLNDGIELDPKRVESLVYRVNRDDGSKQLVSGMYILTSGKTMDDVPEVAGPITVWHDHQNLCWEGGRVVGLLIDGTCRPRGTFRPTAPMLHVWVVDHECGRFAGIEGGPSSHGQSCEHSH